MDVISSSPAPAAPKPLPREADAFRQDYRFLGADHARNERRTRWAVLLFVVACVAGAVGGRLFGSIALIAEGLHMFAHVAALGVAALAYALARRHANDARFSFGAGKFGDLAAFANAVLLVVLAVVIGWESVARMLSPEPVDYRGALITAGFALAVNLAAAVLLADRDGHGHDLNIRAVYIHVLTDALVTVLALAGLALGALFGWRWTDPAAGLIGAALVMQFALSLLLRAARVLLDMVPDPALPAKLRAALEVEGDRVSDLHLWRLGPGHDAALVTIVSAQPQDPDAYRARIAQVARLSHVTVEVRRA